MVQFIKMDVVICLIVLLASCCCSINASTVEEQLLQLQDGFDKMREILEEKNSCMEAQLAAQVVRLERVENQNKILIEEIARLNEIRKTRVLNRANGISNQPLTNAINQMPTSCEDLREIGHTLNGLYSVMGMKSVESVYCDFSNATNDSDFQTWIGHVDVKSTPTYFFVRRSDYFEELGTPILFDIEELNVGAAYDKNSGIFTAPVTGKYFFTVSGLGYFPGSIVSSRYHIQVGLYKNDEAMAFALADEVEVGFQYETFSLQLTLELTKGDQISVRIQGLSPYVSLRAGMFTQFNGFLLEEDITQFLHML
uniref:Neurexin IV n=1 Tax=Daphnia magna TaxID=35525 RepID=A0A0P5NX02_9CRUS